ncbi:MAG: ROK family transcriptional regulator [Lachnospiraceae bacterium]|nr:ROK family transcriptional regulator [Lachnospiraceae bacterium]
MAYNKQMTALKNKRNVIDIIRLNSPINKAEIAKMAGLSIPSVMKITDELEEMKLICSLGRGESTGGKPPEMLTFVTNAFYLIGVDIGRSRVKVILMDMGAQIYERRYMTSTATENPESFLERVADLVEEIIANADIPKERLLGIGIGMPGILNPESGKIIFSPNFMWKDVELLPVFRKRFAAPVLIENANRAMALGEHWYGVSQNVNRVLTVNLGYGIGAAMLDGRKIDRGGSGCSGELGHMILKKDGNICSCGNRGCLESISSGYAIAKTAQQEARNKNAEKILKEAGGIPEDIEAKHVFLAAEAGDMTAQTIIQEAIEYLGIGIANCINLLDPDMVVLAGRIMLSSDYFWEELKAQIGNHQMKYSAMNIRIKKGILGEEATAIGAATLPLRRFINYGASYQALVDL